jgi:N-acetylmuramate 1-kinase
MTQTELEIEGAAAREKALQQWFEALEFQSSEQSLAIVPVSGDASFRRYFRGNIAQQPYILVDAPPDKEDSHAFVRIAGKFKQLNINVPEVLAVDHSQGFMCLSDFGDTLLWEKLDQAQQNLSVSPSATELYQMAFSQLLKIQTCEFDQQFSLPAFDKAHLHREMTLFREWFCEDLLDLVLSEQELGLIESSYEFLINSALAQTQVCVHRDYHSRNLLYQNEKALGVIDFQDAVLGPFSYDLVSLLKDCYISWPREQVNDWALEYGRMALDENIIVELDEAKFLCSFDLMGIQRHLKAIGIFSRLYLRDKRLNYLADIPRTLNYIRAVVNEHVELSEFSQWLEKAVVPHADGKINAILARVGQQ